MKKHPREPHGTKEPAVVMLESHERWCLTYDKTRDKYRLSITYPRPDETYEFEGGSSLEVADKCEEKLGELLAPIGPLRRTMKAVCVQATKQALFGPYKYREAQLGIFHMRSTFYTRRDSAVYRRAGGPCIKMEVYVNIDVCPGDLLYCTTIFSFKNKKLPVAKDLHIVDNVIDLYLHEQKLLKEIIRTVKKH